MTVTGDDAAGGSVDVSLDPTVLADLLNRPGLAYRYVESLDGARPDGPEALRQLAELHRRGLVEPVEGDSLQFEGYQLSVPARVDGETVEFTPTFALVYAHRDRNERLSAFVARHGPSRLAELVSAVERHADGDTTVRQIAGRLGVERHRLVPLVGDVYDVLGLDGPGSDGHGSDEAARSDTLSSAGITD